MSKSRAMKAIVDIVRYDPKTPQVVSSSGEDASGGTGPSGAREGSGPLSERPPISPRARSNSGYRLALDSETERAERNDWLRLWLQIEPQPWKSLVLVPTSESGSRQVLDVAVRLVQIGAVHLGMPIQIADARDLDLSELSQFMAEVEDAASMGERVVVLVGALSESPTHAVVARHADRALLCVPLGATKLKEAEHAIREVGRERFLGSIAFHQS